MASSLAGMIDPTKAGKYPVVLSDALLGKKPKEVYTGVRYNRKPDEPPTHAKLKPSPSSAPNNSYDLTFQDDDGIHKYQGVRVGDDGQYVLIFDPSREVFVLHRVDSMFNLNLIRTPSNNSAESLRQEHPHLPGSTVQKNAKSKDTDKTKERGKASETLAMPSSSTKPKAQPKKRTPPSDGEEDSDEDDDGGLVMEYPGGKKPTQNHDFSPAFAPAVRRFSEFAKNAGEEEDADADGEDDEEDLLEGFKLPSPMNRQDAVTAGPPPREAQDTTMAFTFGDDEDDDDNDDDNEMEDVNTQAQPDVPQDEDNDLDVDLEAELEAELEQGLESDVSEED